MVRFDLIGYEEQDIFLTTDDQSCTTSTTMTVHYNLSSKAKFELSAMPNIPILK